MLGAAPRNWKNSLWSSCMPPIHPPCEQDAGFWVCRCWEYVPRNFPTSEERLPPKLLNGNPYRKQKAKLLSWNYGSQHLWGYPQVIMLVDLACTTLKAMNRQVAFSLIVIIQNFPCDLGLAFMETTASSSAQWAWGRLYGQTSLEMKGVDRNNPGCDVEEWPLLALQRLSGFLLSTKGESVHSTATASQGRDGVVPSHPQRAVAPSPGSEARVPAFLQGHHLPMAAFFLCGSAHVHRGSVGSQDLHTTGLCIQSCGPRVKHNSTPQSEALCVQRQNGAVCCSAQDL